MGGERSSSGTVALLAVAVVFCFAAFTGTVIWLRIAAVFGVIIVGAGLAWQYREKRHE